MDKFLYFLNEHKVKIEKISIIIIFFLFSFIFFKYIFVLVAPFFIGYCIAMFLEPLVRLLMNKLRLNRATSGAISIVLMVVVIGGGLFLVITQLFAQIKVFLSENPSYYFGLLKDGFDKIVDYLPNLFFYIPEKNMAMINEIMNGFMDKLLAFFAVQLQVIGLKIVKFIPKFFVYLLIGIISSFFFIKDKILINNLYRDNMPMFIKEHVKNVKFGMIKAFFGYLKSQSIIMCVTASISLVGLLIFQNDYALLLAFCIAIVDVLPVFGSGFVLWPLSVISFMTGDVKMGVGALVIYITNQIVRQIIEPKILGGQIGLHPLVTLMSVYGGIIIFGVLGILLGPMSVIIIKTIWESEKVI